MTRNKVQNVVAFTLLILSLFLIVYFFGYRDWFAGGLFILIWIGLYSSTYAMRMAVRNSVRAYFREGTGLYAFFSQEKSFFQMALAAVLSFFLTVAFFVYIKSLWLSHGWVGFTVAFALSGIFCVRILSEYGGGKIDKKILSPSASSSNFSLAGFLLLVVATNVFLSLVFSARDLYGFLSASTNFENFIFYAESLSIDRGEYNSISRVLINVSIIAESFRIAMANEILMAFDFDMEARDGNAYYVFYLIATGINLATLIPVSMGLVLLANYFHMTASPLLIKSGKRVAPVVGPILVVLSKIVKRRNKVVGNED